MFSNAPENHAAPSMEQQLQHTSTEVALRDAEFSVQAAAVDSILAELHSQAANSDLMGALSASTLAAQDAGRLEAISSQMEMAGVSVHNPEAQAAIMDAATRGWSYAADQQISLYGSGPEDTPLEAEGDPSMEQQGVEEAIAIPVEQEPDTLADLQPEPIANQAEEAVAIPTENAPSLEEAIQAGQAELGEEIVREVPSAEYLGSYTIGEDLPPSAYETLVDEDGMVVIPETTEDLIEEPTITSVNDEHDSAFHIPGHQGDKIFSA